MVGAAYAFAVLGALSIGIFILPVAVLGTIYLVRRHRDLRSVTGILSGAGVPLLVVAALNRSGPGLVCTDLAAGGQRCEQQMSPWPWAIAGVLFLALGVAAHLLVHVGRTDRSDEEPTMP